MQEDKELSEAQNKAFDKLIDEGGTDRWVPTKGLAHPKTITSLYVRKIIQLAEIDGKQHAALAGIMLEHTLED